LEQAIFPVVKLGINKKTGEKRAIKIIDKKKYWNTTNLDQIQREIDILRKIKHENITSIFEIYSTERFLYIVLELATGGELFENIIEKGSYSEQEAQYIFTQMLSAVNYLHSHGIAHRDLKPENILLESQDGMKVKITDFGLARIVGERDMMTTLCGTPQYVAPEIIKQSLEKEISNEMNKGYGKEVDLWSLGAILYVLLSGSPPFDDERGIPLYTQIENGMYDFPPEYWCDISDSAQDLIKRLLTVDPKKRLTVQQALQHSWITGGQQKKDLAGVKQNMKKLKSFHRKNTLSPIKIPYSREGSDTEDESGPSAKKKETKAQSKK